MNQFLSNTLILVFSLGLFSSFAYSQNKSWTEDSFEDFRDGSFSASGIDLYITREGTIKSINRYDLNNDGYLDLVFNSGHDVDFAVPPTLYSIESDRKDGTLQELPVDGSKQIKVADLNNNGYDDAVFLPNNNGVSPRRYLSILWGDENEWINRRKTQLVTISPLALEIADLNSNSWTDLIVLNGSRWSPQDGSEPVLRIYWGDEQGYQQNRYKDIVIDNAIDVVARDLDNNGYIDLIVLQDDPGRLQIYWNPGQSDSAFFSDPQQIHLNTPAVGQLAVADYTNDGWADLIVTGGNRELIGLDPTTLEEEYTYTGVLLVPADAAAPRRWKSPVTIEAPPASDLKVADLNEDGWVDIVLADRSADQNSVHILWGDESGLFQEHLPIYLSVGYASAIDIDDIDGDSHSDIAVAVHRSSEAYESSSLIFYGDGTGQFTRAPYTIPSAGASAIAIVSDSGQDSKKILIANSRAGSYYEDVPARIYWGAHGGFDPDSVSYFDIRSGYTAAAADLNDNGFVDLVLLSIVHAIKEPHPGIGFNILWGGPDGLQQDRRTVLNEYGLFDVSIADVNKNGYLDLVGSVGYQSPDGEPPGVVVWYGGPDGYFPENRDRIPTEARPTQHVLADFNKDGHLDVALLIGNKHKISILWGSDNGFSSQQVTSWPFLRGGDINAADLDGDGWLDLVASSLLIPNSLFYDFGTYIFWGGPEGFDPTNAQKLTGHGTVGITIADWDQNGFLDIFLPSYKYAETREAIASYLYWGSSNGFSNSMRTEFLQNSSHGAMAGDFSGDGKLDLAVSNHRSNDNHSTNSRVFYNKDARFENKKEQLLPTVGSEFIYSDDVGAQYNRSYEKLYTSSDIKSDRVYNKGAIEIQGYKPGETELHVSIRTAESPEALKQSFWKLIDFEASHEFAIPSTDSYLQYQLTFISDNGDRYPEVDKVKISVLSD